MTAWMTVWMTACMWTGGVSLRDINTRTGDGWSRSWPRIRGGRQKQTGARSQHCPATQHQFEGRGQEPGPEGAEVSFQTRKLCRNIRHQTPPKIAIHSSPRRVSALNFEYPQTLLGSLLPKSLSK